MKFKKKRHTKRTRRSDYTQAYIEERRKELNELLEKAKTEQDKEILRKAFYVSIKP